jgi:hypothetical protein
MLTWKSDTSSRVSREARVDAPWISQAITSAFRNLGENRKRTLRPSPLYGVEDRECASGKHDGSCAYVQHR